ncbi:MAG: L,D-transpeptidase family protein [Longilinea sp.]|nr:L,D-transpeptidase family protein [Longilinea sp.]MCA1954231.1 L,D-transpeptidase family protein [Anaerolinea sp.]
MTSRISRREFLRRTALGLAALGSLAFSPRSAFADMDGVKLARVAISSVSVYRKPSDKSEILFQRYRDEILHIYEEVVSPEGPYYNPLWYRVWGGYVHSGNTQRVHYALNPIVSTITKPQIAEVTVPYTQAMWTPYRREWQPVYRLYYSSIHWITGLVEGPDGEPWYKLKDELLKIEYCVPAPHLRLIAPEELSPLSPEVPSTDKRIDVSLSRQTLTAYEGDKIVLQTRVATGVPNRNISPNSTPTETPRGEFRIASKVPSKHMGDGNITSDLEAYELPGVPWVSFFEPKTGVALHGTYWHTNYGVPMSHGCVNLRNEDALWLYRWTTPVVNPDKADNIGFGTLVTVA